MTTTYWTVVELSREALCSQTHIYRLVREGVLCPHPDSERLGKLLITAASADLWLAGRSKRQQSRRWSA